MLFNSYSTGEVKRKKKSEGRFGNLTKLAKNPEGLVPEEKLERNKDDQKRNAICLKVKILGLWVMTEPERYV